MTPEERAFLRALAAEYHALGSEYHHSRRTPAINAASTLLGALSVSVEAPTKENERYKCEHKWCVSPGQRYCFDCGETVQVAAPPPEKEPRPCDCPGALTEEHCTRCGHAPHEDACKHGAAPPKEPRLCMNMLCDGADCDCPACVPKEPPSPSLASEDNSPNIGINAPSPETRSVEETIRKIAEKLTPPNSFTCNDVRDLANEAMHLYRDEKEAFTRRRDSDSADLARAWAAHEKATEEAAALRAERDELRRALGVFLFSLKTRRWLDQNDPKAVEQAFKALRRT